MSAVVLLAVLVIGALVGYAAGRMMTVRQTAHPPAADEFRRAVARVGEVLASTHDRATIVRVVLETSLVAVRANAAVFYSGTGRRLSALAAEGVEGMEDVRLGGGQGLAAWVAEHHRPACHPPGPRPCPPEPHRSTAMAVPVEAEGRPFGVLAVYGRTPRHADQPFRTEDLEALRGFALQAGAAIDNTFLHEEASRLSITDGLTGVWNRRHFDLRATEELERSIRFGEPFSVVLADVDNFKRINDTQGHQIGDAVLVELARRLTATTREVDLVARYGGEEFALLLSRTDLAGGHLVADKLRQTVGFEPFRVGEVALPVTMSVGVASYPECGTTVKELVAGADEALYRAKAGGKNRVEAAKVVMPLEGRHTA